MELKSVNMEDYNSGTLIIHSERDSGTMNIKEDPPSDPFPGVKNKFSGGGQNYQHYVEIRKNADQAILTSKLVKDRHRLRTEIGGTDQTPLKGGSSTRTSTCL